MTPGEPVPTVAFFNNKGGVGKTSLVYHVAWMLADLEVSTIAIDLDPQANLTAAFLDEERLEELWGGRESGETVFSCVKPLMTGEGDIRPPVPERIDDNLHLVVGDLELSCFEDELSNAWLGCNDRRERAFRVTSAFWRTLQDGACQQSAQIVLIDLGPNLGAINRSAMISANYILAPLAPDLFSLQGLRNLGPTVESWRSDWTDRASRNPLDSLSIPPGEMTPIGYVLMQHAERLNRPTRAYAKWAQRIPAEYRENLKPPNLFEEQVPSSPAEDPLCLAQLKHYRSLMPMAQEARKPIFHLKAADGVLGNHVYAVREAYNHFKALTKRIASKADVPIHTEDIDV